MSKDDDEYTVNQLADLAELTIKDTQMENAPPKPITQLLDEYIAESPKSNEKFKFLIYFTFSLLDNVIANFKLVYVLSFINSNLLLAERVQRKTVSN